MVTVASADFDTYLIVGRYVDGVFVESYRNDDDDGTNSAVRFRPDVSGEHVAFVTRYNAGVGAYTLTVSDSR